MAKIAFDSTGFTYDDRAWREVIERLERHLLSQGLPPVCGDRWEEWEDGCLFDGTEEEAIRVQEILALYAVAIWEIDQEGRAKRIN
jgi:hypothetical protein